MSLWTGEHVFDTLGRWDSATRRSRGSSSSTSSLIGVTMAVRRAHRRGQRRRRQPGVVAQAPALRAAAEPRAARRCRALRRAALPLELLLPRRCLATPRSWPRRPPASASRRSPSPTTTASTAWSASPRRPGRSACPPCSAPSSPLGADRHRRTAWPTPRATHLVVLADGPRRLRPPGRARSAAAQLAGEKGAPRTSLAALADETARATVACQVHWWVLTGCRKGAVPRGARRPTARRRPRASCSGWSTRSGATGWSSSCGTTATRSTRPATTRWPSWPLATRSTCVATNNVHYATPARRPLATALAAVRARRSLDELDPWLPGGAGAHLRSGAEQARRFARYPGVVEPAAELGRACAFDLALVAPEPAAVPVPATATTR